MENTELRAREIAEKSLRIAGQICIYTNDQMTIEELKRPQGEPRIRSQYTFWRTPTSTIMAIYLPGAAEDQALSLDE